MAEGPARRRRDRAGQQRGLRRAAVDHAGRSPIAAAARSPAHAAGATPDRLADRPTRCADHHAGRAQPHQLRWPAGHRPPAACARACRRLCVGGPVRRACRDPPLHPRARLGHRLRLRAAPACRAQPGDQRPARGGVHRAQHRRHDPRQRRPGRPGPDPAEHQRQHRRRDRPQSPGHWRARRWHRPCAADDQRHDRVRHRRRARARAGGEQHLHRLRQRRATPDRLHALLLRALPLPHATALPLPTRWRDRRGAVPYHRRRPGFVPRS